jgi:pseudaminic acid cytidylyltransferase
MCETKRVYSAENKITLILDYIPMSNIAFIPARGGSKRIPRKNILDVCGKPMLSYPIEIAKNNRLFDEVIVSTDDKEIATIAEKLGAKVHHRDSLFAEDDVNVDSVCYNFIKERFEKGTPFKYLCCIYATAIFLTEEDINLSYAEFKKEPAPEYVMGVSRYNYSPIQALKQDNGYFEMLLPEYKGVQSQEYPQTYVSNGTLYWADTEAFLKEKTFYGKKLGVYEVPESHTLDIDEPEDFERACQRMTERLKNGTY